MEEATSTAVGVASPSAHGHAITRTSMASLVPSMRAALLPAAATVSRAAGNMDAPAHAQLCCLNSQAWDDLPLINVVFTLRLAGKTDVEIWIKSNV